MSKIHQIIPLTTKHKNPKNIILFSFDFSVFDSAQKPTTAGEEKKVKKNRHFIFVCMCWVFVCMNDWTEEEKK